MRRRMSEHAFVDVHICALAQDLDNRRVVATFSGRLGDKSSTVLEALSTALCTVNNPTDFR
jgi:hypothetical protein